MDIQQLAEQAVRSFMMESKVGMMQPTFERYSNFLQNKAKENPTNSELDMATNMQTWLRQEMSKFVAPFVQIDMFPTLQQQQSLF